MSSSSATRLPKVFGCGEQSGTQEWSTQEGPRNTGRFWLRGTSVPTARPDRSKDQRTFGPRSRVDRSGSSQEGAVRWKATPELVSQDREAGCQTFRGAGPGQSNTGISFARRIGGWQQCRPPFLLGTSRCPAAASLRLGCPRGRLSFRAPISNPGAHCGAALPSTNGRKPNPRLRVQGGRLAAAIRSPERRVDPAKSTLRGPRWRARRSLKVLKLAAFVLASAAAPLAHRFGQLQPTPWFRTRPGGSGSPSPWTADGKPEGLPL